jgi:hypothetical protein
MWAVSNLLHENCDLGPLIAANELEVLIYDCLKRESNPEILQLSLLALDRMLALGDPKVKVRMETSGTLDALEDLQNHKIREINELSLEVLTKYFDV